MIKRTKDKIVRDVRNLFEQEEDYYELARVGVILIGTIMLNMKAMVIKIKASQSENTLIKLNHA